MKETVTEKKRWEKPVIKLVVLQFDKDVVASCQTNSSINAAAACKYAQGNPCN